MITIRKDDGLILKSGSRMIAEGSAWNKGNPCFDDWRVAAWTENREYRFPIQLIAIVEVWRNGVRIDNVEREVQLNLFEQ